MSLNTVSNGDKLQQHIKLNPVAEADIRHNNFLLKSNHGGQGYKPDYKSKFEYKFTAQIQVVI